MHIDNQVIHNYEQLSTIGCPSVSKADSVLVPAELCNSEAYAGDDTVMKGKQSITFKRASVLLVRERA